MNNVAQLRPYDGWRNGADPEQSEMFETGSPIWIQDGEWDERDIARRPWIVPGYLMRGSVTVLSGPGASGKSMLTVAWAVALALGTRIGRFSPREQRTCMIYNVEDDDNEQRRRFSAALREAKAHPADLAGKVVRLGPHNVGTLLSVNPVTGRLTATASMQAIETLIEERRPDVVFLDPFVELHDSEENDNTAVRSVMARFRQIASTYQCAVCLLHHARKGIAGMAGDPDSLRGASAIVGAARVVLTMMSMDEKEAEKFGIAPDQRLGYFRVDGAKSNYAALEEAEWFRRASHELANGDTVPAAVPWVPPSPLRDVPVAELNAALDRIAEGPRPGVLYAGHRRGRSNDRWAGQVLVTHLGLNEKQAADLIGKWLTNGVLVESTFRDPVKREDRTGVIVIDARRPTE